MDDNLTVEQLQLQVKKLEKENRLLQKKLSRSVSDRKKLEKYHDNQSELFNQTMRRLEKARSDAEQRQLKLQQAFDELQVMQSKLVESEKMSAVGVLMAGIAHEINNPISFIHGNIAHAQHYVDDLLAVFQCYQEVYPEPDSRITEILEERDLDFVVEDIHKLLKSMRVGGDRILKIVSGLRSFSRLDHAGFKAADLHEGMDSTLMLLQHRFKMKANDTDIKLIKNYGKLPPVTCFAGELNQVFMNILSNAIDAIEERIKKSSKSEQKNFIGQIEIQTAKVDSQWVEIVISDNGIGMESGTQQRIFDPFFTTKSVGKGTGLGMSISYKIIVEKHHGKINCISRFGKGTDFTIKLPLNPRLSGLSQPA